MLLHVPVYAVQVFESNLEAFDYCLFAFAQPCTRVVVFFVGFVVAFGNGFTVYHAGDTAVFKDMELIRELYHPELALLPIGSHYVMNPKEAALACRLLLPKFVIPMHYGTFPVLTGTPAELAQLLQDQPATRVIPLKPGETVE